jgi:hypothetical protein
MSRFKFWKRDSDTPPESTEPARVTRFNVSPRTDVGGQQVPADPQQAARLSALRKQREALLHEVETAISASRDTNRWRMEIALIGQALGEVQDDLAALPTRGGEPGIPLPATPIHLGPFATEPAVSLEIVIDNVPFRLEEAVDWAERGFQRARSELALTSGDMSLVIPDSFPSDQRSAVIDHLQQSLIAYATDVRDHLLEGSPPPLATLAELAPPSEEFGGWLLWSGQSPFAAELALQQRALYGERERLERERATLLDEQAKAVEGLPVAKRRLADVEREIAAIESDAG